jgi:hypothetical protein
VKNILSNWKINASVEEKLMFFLGKRKDLSANKTTQQLRNKTAGPEKPAETLEDVRKENLTRTVGGAPSEKEAPVRVKVPAEEPEIETPVKVIIPASALKEELTDEVILEREMKIPLDAVPEEVADSLLVMANPEESILEPAAAKTEVKESLFSDLFGQIQEEENPIVRLIKSLPDVSMEELVVQAEETRRWINEWSENRGTYYADGQGDEFYHRPNARNIKGSIRQGSGIRNE